MDTNTLRALVKTGVEVGIDKAMEEIMEKIQMQEGGDEVTWSRLKKNYEAERKAAEDMRALWPAISWDMAVLRDAHPSNKEFAAALALHEVEYSKDDRSALINLGRLSEEQWTTALACFSTRSIQHLWRAVKAEPVFVTDEDAMTNPKTPESTTESGEISEIEPEKMADDFDEPDVAALFSADMNPQAAKVASNKIKQLPDSIREKVVTRLAIVAERKPFKRPAGVTVDGFSKEPEITINHLFPTIPAHRADKLTLRYSNKKWSGHKNLENAWEICEATEAHAAPLPALERNQAASKFWETHYVNEVPLGEKEAPKLTVVDDSTDEDQGYPTTIFDYQVWPRDDGISWKSAAAAIMLWRDFNNAVPGRLYSGKDINHVAENAIRLMDDDASKVLGYIGSACITAERKAQEDKKEFPTEIDKVYVGLPTMQLEQSVGIVKRS